MKFTYTLIFELTLSNIYVHYYFITILLYHLIQSNTSSILCHNTLTINYYLFYKLKLHVGFLSPLIHLPQPLLLRSNPQYLLQIPRHSLNIGIHLFNCPSPITILNLPPNHLFTIIFFSLHIHISIHRI